MRGCVPDAIPAPTRVVTAPAFVTPQSNERLLVIDALRGFALAGILILHHIERFNYFLGSPRNPAWAQAWDGSVQSFFFFIFGSKSYAIFSMLFGFSFWMMYSKRQAQGYDFSGRFVWRITLLAGFGLIHSLYYPGGDLLLWYALWGLLVVVVRKWSDRSLFLLAIALLLQPQYLWRIFRLLTDGQYTLPADHTWALMQNVMRMDADGSFLPWMYASITDGFMANASWMWAHGRLLHIPGLFLIGMLACRRKVFTDMVSRRWIVLGASALALWVPVFAFLHSLSAWERTPLVRTLASLAEAYGNVALTVVVVSLFILIWRTRPGEWLLSVFVAHGRMSLTNYMLGSLCGVFIYFNWGLRLFPFCGATISVFIGFFMLTLHLAGSRLWLRYFGQGPMEKLWRRLTWPGRSGKPA
jgi:uncharacterized protein